LQWLMMRPVFKYFTVAVCFAAGMHQEASAEPNRHAKGDQLPLVEKDTARLPQEHVSRPFRVDDYLLDDSLTRETAQALITHGSASQKLHGIQMLEQMRKYRELLTTIENSDVPTSTKHKAAAALRFGDPDTALALLIKSPSPLPENAINQLDELSHSFIHCSAFFYVVADGIKQRSDPSQTDTVQSYIRYGDLMRDKAAIISAQIGQKPEVIKIRWEMSVKSLWAEMDNHYKNFAIILNKYLDRCVALHTDALLR
jgi:hypothetical protein